MSSTASALRTRFRSNRIANFTESVIREMTRLAFKHGAINLAQGFPDFPAPEALKRADAVVLTRTGAVGPDRLEVLRAEVSMHMKPSSGLLESRHEPLRLISLQSRKSLPPSDLQGKKVLAISAIGNPKARLGGADNVEISGRVKTVRGHWGPQEISLPRVASSDRLPSQLNAVR